MQRLSSRTISASLIALTALLGGCATSGGSLPPNISAGWATEPASFEASPASAVGGAVSRPQDMMPEMSEIHPPTMVSFGVGIGKQTLEVNTGDTSGSAGSGVLTGSTSSARFRLRGEHFFESGFGVFGEAYIGIADDIDDDFPRGVGQPTPSSSLDSNGIFLAAAFRATMDDDFRLPVRFGPFMQMSDQSDSTFADGSIERSTIGVRLSAEPEVILFQTNDSGSISELSVFGEVRAGAGPTEVKDNVDSEDGYAFTLDYEIGVRYRFGNGLMTSLSYVGQKYHVGTTETYNNATFFGVDDDFTGIMITAGLRF